MNYVIWRAHTLALTSGGVLIMFIIMTTLRIFSSNLKQHHYILEYKNVVNTRVPRASSC